MDGFHAAITGLLDSLAEKGTPNDTVTILPGLVSPADLRHLREMMTDFSLAPVILPDYSDTLDGPALVSYQNIPDGGTTIDEIKKTGGSQAVIEFGRTLADLHGGGELLSTRFGVSRHCLGLPMGIRETDAFVEVLTSLSGCAVMPAKYSALSAVA